MEEKEKESSVIQLANFKIKVIIHHLPQAAKDLHSAKIRLEAHVVPSKQAEAIIAAITGVLNDSLENVAHSFVSKAEMQKSDMIQDANLSKFKSEAQSSQEHHFSLLQHETEKLRGHIEKMRNELKYKIDMVTSGKCLDLTLERGCIRDELAKQNAETTNKLDREIHALRAHLEAAMTHRFKELLSSSNLPSTFSPKLISITASTSSHQAKAKIIPVTQSKIRSPRCSRRKKEEEERIDGWQSRRKVSILYLAHKVKLSRIICPAGEKIIRKSKVENIRYGEVAKNVCRCGRRIGPSTTRFSNT